MHNLMLFGQIPESRHDQIMQILAGLCALPNPRPILERHYIFRPKKDPVRRAEQIGGSQNVTDVHKAARKAKAEEEEFRYSTLIEDLSVLEQRRHGGDKQMGEDGGSTVMREPSGSTRFTLQVTDLPEPEVKSVMSLARSLTPMTSEDPLKALDNQDQRFVNQYLVQGHQFVYNNVGIRLQRCMIMTAKSNGATIDSQTQVSECELTPWDKSGAYVIEACVAVADGKNPELIARATEELRRMKEDLRGCVDLRTVERLCMDPRVR